jgi:hypothetical protein
MNSTKWRYFLANNKSWMTSIHNRVFLSLSGQCSSWQCIIHIGIRYLNTLHDYIHLYSLEQIIGRFCANYNFHLLSILLFWSFSQNIFYLPVVRWDKLCYSIGCPCDPVSILVHLRFSRLFLLSLQLLHWNFGLLFCSKEFQF